ncbi:MAG TPA: MauE/DoxX family redox-associated membrane protein [Ilumatobacteraceae bacterium]
MIAVVSAALGLIFVFSSVLKISAPHQWRSQSGGLGVPWAVAIVVPFAEAVVGALLVTQLARRPVAVLAAAMLLAFTVLLVRRLRQGLRPPCACFGTLSAQPIGWGNVIRNAVFLLMAAVVAVWGG